MGDQCPICKRGSVSPEQTDGRFIEHPSFKGVYINLPVDYEIVRCDNHTCREFLFLDAEVAPFWKMVDEELEKHRALVVRAVERFREKQKK